MARGDSVPPLWALLGRETDAGRALFSLYGGDEQGRARGRQYSHANMQRRAAQRRTAAADARQQRPPAPAKAKATVVVPHFRQRPASTPGSGASRLAAVPRRRTAEAIRAAAAEEGQAVGQAPHPGGRLIDQAEKERCALLMQFRGSVPSRLAARPASHAEASAGAGTGAQASSRALLQQRFNEAAQGVASREEFVAGLRALGRLQPCSRDAVRAEVAAKVREMRELDARMRELDAGSAQGPPPGAA